LLSTSADPGTFAYYKMRNAWKAKRWNAMTTEEKAHCESFRSPAPISAPR